MPDATVGSLELGGRILRAKILACGGCPNTFLPLHRMTDPSVGADPAMAVEQGVLGCLLLGAPIPPTIKEQFFSKEIHKVIFDTIERVTAENAKDDVVLIATTNRLRLRGMLDGTGGIDYLATLMDAAPSKHNLEYWLPQLKDLHGRRTLRADMEEFIKGLDDPATKVDTLVNASRKTLEYLSETRNGKTTHLTFRTPMELLNMVFDDSDCIMGNRQMAKGQNCSLCGASSAGKSRLVLQQAVSIITGRPFLSFETHGRGTKWLFLQAENSNRRYQHDLVHLRHWIGEEDLKIVEECLVFHTLETDTDGFLHLDRHENIQELEYGIAKYKPDVVVFDSLYNFQIGDLNKDADMLATLLELSRLCKTGNPNRVPMVLHHAITGKAGASKVTGYDRASFSRNSKVLHAWTRGQINVAACSPENNEQLIISCGKCSNGPEFTPFSVRLDPQTLIYSVDPDFDISAWQSTINGTPIEPVMNSVRVRELCPVYGCSKSDLAKLITQDCGCSRATAFRHSLKAEKSHSISFSFTNQLYFRK